MKDKNIELPEPRVLYFHTREQVVAAIETDRQQRGEPVGYIGKYEMESLTRNGVSVTVYPSESIETIPVYTAPQPAAPTQEPSDDDLHNLWSRSGGVMRTFARALLARYGGARSSVPLTMGQRAVASELLSCFEAWEPGVRVLGNVQAKDGADLMEAVLAGARLCVPDGWKFVPKVPTHEMIVAFVEQWYCHRQSIDDPQMDDAYQAMLAAAPEPPCET